MTTLRCPYCNEEIEDPDDCYDTRELYQWECPECERWFVFDLEYERIYDARKADCLNGSPHDYKETVTYPKEFSRLQCKMCGDEKPLPK